MSNQTTNSKDECVNGLYNLFELINNSTTDITPITEGELLEASKDALKIKKIIDTWSSEIYELEQENIILKDLVKILQKNRFIKSLMKERKKHPNLSDGEKLQSGNYKRCEYCDSILLIKSKKGEFDKNHYMTKKCGDIYFKGLMEKNNKLFKQHRRDGAIILRNEIWKKILRYDNVGKYREFLQKTNYVNIDYDEYLKIKKVILKKIYNIRHRN